jgi:hypothetical protein
MKRMCFLILLIIPLVLVLVGCRNSNGQTFNEYLSEVYPRIEYRNSSYNFDANNREITVLDGYVLDQGNSYEWVETEDGYDLIIHFEKGGEG